MPERHYKICIIIKRGTFPLHPHHRKRDRSESRRAELKKSTIVEPVINLLFIICSLLGGKIHSNIYGRIKDITRSLLLQVDFAVYLASVFTERGMIQLRCLNCNELIYLYYIADVTVANATDCRWHF